MEMFRLTYVCFRIFSIIFLNDILMWTSFKVFIELVTTLLLFYVLVLFGCEACGILVP